MVSLPSQNSSRQESSSPPDRKTVATGGGPHLLVDIHPPEKYRGESHSLEEFLIKGIVVKILCPKANIGFHGTERTLGDIGQVLFRVAKFLVWDMLCFGTRLVMERSAPFGVEILYRLITHNALAIRRVRRLVFRSIGSWLRRWGRRLPLQFQKKPGVVFPLPDNALGLSTHTPHL